MKIKSNSTVTLTEDCDLISSVCTTVLVDFKAASMRLIARKDKISIFNGTFDMCNKKTASNLMFKSFTGFFGFPPNCNLQKVRWMSFQRHFMNLSAQGEYCNNGTKMASLSKLKHLLPVFKGHVKMEAFLTHDVVSFSSNWMNYFKKIISRGIRALKSREPWATDSEIINIIIKNLVENLANDQNRGLMSLAK